MKNIKSILIIVGFIFCFLAITGYSDQNESVPGFITEISADQNKAENLDQISNLSESFSSTAGCPSNSLFSQQYQLPSPNTWEAKTSDDGASGNILALDNFVNTGSINKICFWGINAFHEDGNWYICYESPMNFIIRIYDDNNGYPGTTLIASYEVSCEANFTGLIYGGAFELYQYFVELPEPIEIDSGWIAVQGVGGNPECWFEWMSSVDGHDAFSYQWDGYALNYVNNDRAFCLQHLEYICGDVDGDNTVGLFDMIYFIYYKYKDGPPPVSMSTADINKDGSYNILDVVFLANFLYKNGTTPSCP